ncbi:hypothetical protein EJN90_10435 [Jeotgalibaca ciconiae]|uniref:Uncharacterized protein n=1 Tax=Jeotgalibaca ciconiae TaxID=2496265 RepID=A0A3S9HCC1_9LACT|nr:hypothetical protein EJN90_10435 [Jeotgalibaca ciconiae]
MRASLLIQGQISYFFIGQGGLVRFSYSRELYIFNETFKLDCETEHLYFQKIKMFDKEFSVEQLYSHEITTFRLETELEDRYYWILYFS